MERRTPLKRGKGLSSGSKPLQRKAALSEGKKRPGPTREVSAQGGQARARQLAARAGIPEDVRRDERGRACVEKTCLVCGGTYLALWAGHTRRKTCSKRCADQWKRERSPDRAGAANPNYRNGSRVGVRDRAGEERWKAALGSRCEHPACPREHRRLHLHHVCYRQEVQRRGGDVYDPRNAFTICEGCHGSHHRRGKYVVPLAALPDSAFAFAAELMGSAAHGYLRRRYSGEDSRLDALAAIEAS